MTLVRGSLVSWKPCSMSRAALIIGKFLDDDTATATDPSVKNYLRRAAVDFETSSPSDLPIRIADEVDALPKHLHTREEEVCDDSRHAKSSKNTNDHTSVSSVKKKKKKRKHRDQDPTESEVVDSSKKKKRKKNKSFT